MSSLDRLAHLGNWRILNVFSSSIIYLTYTTFLKLPHWTRRNHQSRSFPPILRLWWYAPPLLLLSSSSPSSSGCLQETVVFLTILHSKYTTIYKQTSPVEETNRDGKPLQNSMWKRLKILQKWGKMPKNSQKRQKALQNRIRKTKISTAMKN